MVTQSFELGLPWLPTAPQDLRQQMRALPEAEHPGAEVQRLAGYALNANQLDRLAKVMAELRGQGRSLAPLTPFKLGVLGTGTLDLLAVQLVGSAARHGVDLECVTAPFGQIAQQAFDPSSAINAAGCDAVLLALDHRDLPLTGESGVEESLALLRGLRQALRNNGKALSIVQTLAEPPEPLFGHFDARWPGSLRAKIRAFNQALIEDLAASPDLLLDVASMAGTVGTGNWFSPGEWHLAKLPVAMACLPFYADHVGRLLGALRGKARRVLVLDLDNTLWSGIIGDDGMGGIRLGQGDPVGEAHLALQQQALALHGRGIVLAVCSKNEEATARQVFREHPDMVLREEHIAVFQANWVDKAANLRAIAEELSLGLSSFVFVDDNPAERAIIRQRLPEVAVPELPEDPALYTRVLALAGYFEATGFSAEDAARTGFYQDNARRAKLLEASDDLDSYLASLEMEIRFAPFDAMGRERIVQLINKSNQFNLTTRRYTEVEIAAIEQRSEGTTLQVRLADRFGDNGMISTLVLTPSAPDTWHIDLWLMSCRVLGRRVEDAVLNEISRLAREQGVLWLEGTYRPTDRNMMVRDHYARLGFERLGEEADGTTRWRWSTAKTRPEPPMQVSHG
ncbi:HAD-IIIC family phosphatase [Novosphingobium terrae]|uniref:HAD-IIIC family phosphatase n=1 Tax=Novosphingobium terrae TaxID=2726189 RepID=UPI0019810F80|nr:HAD-IIIC family phosphatase [Novosphingobium terrae]